MPSQCPVHLRRPQPRAERHLPPVCQPAIPSSVERHEPWHWGYSCLFTAVYLREDDRSESLSIFHLNDAQTTYAKGIFIFQKILTEQGTEHLYKGDLTRAYLQLLLHEAPA